MLLQQFYPKNNTKNLSKNSILKTRKINKKESKDSLKSNNEREAFLMKRASQKPKESRSKNNSRSCQLSRNYLNGKKIMRVLFCSKKYRPKNTWK
jgi:hypothetical protein